MANSVKELQRQYKRDSEVIIRIFNPDMEDFTVPYGGKAHTIRAMEIQPFPFFLANHIKKHLANHIMNKRGGPKNGNVEATLKDISEQIDVL